MSGNSVGLYGQTSTANVAGGNVTGLYRQNQAVIVDNGYDDADVQAFLETYTGNIQCGNIDVLTAATVNAIFTDGYYYANGTPLAVGGNAYGNANVADFLPTYTGNLGGGNLILTSSAFVGNSITVTNGITTGGTITAGTDIQAAGNIRTTGASGNITGADYIQSNFFVGDGSLLTNVAGTGYGNANVSNYLASGTNTANIITTGNVSGSFILGNISYANGFPEVYGNSNVATFLANFGSNVIVTTGNITAGNMATGHLATTGNVTISGVLFSDDITSTSVTVYGDQIITGNLTVQGTTTSLNSNVVTINDKTITVANNASTQATVDGSGLEAGTPAIATWLYNALTDSWQSNIAITATGNLTQDLGKNTNRWATVYAGDANISANVTALGNISGSYILGNGSQLTGLPEGYGNANVVTLLANFGSNTISTTGNITAGYFIGNGSLLSSITGANVTGTVANAAFATDSAHATVADTANSVTGGNVTGSVAQANYANIANSVSGANVTGSVAQADYANTANAVAGGNVSGQVANALVAGTVYTAAQPAITSVGTLVSLAVTGNITSSANIAGSYILGNGSQLTGLPDTGNSFSTIDANGTNIVASTSSDTLTLVAGTNITITGNAISDSITISSTAAGGGDSLSPFLLMGG